MSYNKPMNVFSPESAASAPRAQSLRASARGVAAQAMGGGSNGNFARLMQDPQGMIAPGLPKVQGKIVAGPGVSLPRYQDIGMNGTAKGAGLEKVLENSNSPLSVLSSARKMQENAMAGQSVSKKPEGGKKFAGPELPEGQNSAPAGKMSVNEALDAAVKYLGLGSLVSGAAGEDDTLDVSGVLSEKYESGSKGISAIGYDRNGGTSYGKYQIASRPGTMNGFIKFLTDEAPDLAERLKASGPANTGGRRGKMPETWQRIAEEQPERFEKLQDEFIRKSHFLPALEAIAQKTGLAVEQFGSTVKEVLFSTAVQHGPVGAARIFARAINRIGHDKLNNESKPELAEKANEDLIKQVYSLRSNQFASSAPEVQAAVKNRLRAEMSDALNMFKTA